MITMQDSDVTIAFSTLGGRAQGILRPPQSGIRYLTLIQSPKKEQKAQRDPRDRIERLDSLGLSDSRNAAISMCETDFLLFADDDHRLDLDSILQLTGTLQEDPSLSFVVGHRARSIGPAKGGRSTKLTRWNTGRICAPELIIRVSSIRQKNVRFDTNFGIGARYPIGEDYVFVTDMLAQGCLGQAFPIITGYHDGPSTGDKWNDRIILEARKAVLKRVFRRLHLLVRLGYTMRHYKKFSDRKDAVHFLLSRVR